MSILKNLLENDFVKSLAPDTYKGFSNINAPTESTDKENFDLKDKEIPFIVKTGTGSVTYVNPKNLNILVTNYEDFINSLPKNIQHGIKRCDFLLYQDKSTFFILNELSQSRNFDSKESDALYQLQNTLEKLYNVETIKNCIESCSDKLCIFSNRIKISDAPKKGMIDGFNETFITQIRKSEPFDFDGINKYGFLYYKANQIEINDKIILKQM